VRELTPEALQAGARDAEHLEVLRAIGLSSTMIVPIRAGARILGAMSFVSSTSRRFDERDLELAGDLGRQVGVFIHNARLHAEQAEIAHVLQAGLVPDTLPELPGWEVAVAYRAAGTANEAGGDFYDVIPFGDGWAAVIGDVVGKGAEAAALTALARHTLAALLTSTGDAVQALDVLNRRLRDRGPDQRSLCTISVVTVNSDDRATLYSAGHPLPLLLRDRGVQVVGRTSPPLGVFDGLQFAPSSVNLLPGDELLLYTDGVLDAVGQDGRFGESRLMRAIIGERANGISTPDRLLAAVDAFLLGEQNDDIAILSLVRDRA
jgi:serine phosphatase RsbU (regulator of sigma subunit)